MVRLHLNRQKDHCCHQLCLQRTSLEDKLKYWTSAESNDSTVIQPKVMRTMHLQAFQPPKSGLNGMVTWMIRMGALTTGRQSTNPILSLTMASRLRKPQITATLVVLQLFLDWFGQHGGQCNRLKMGWWRSLQWKQGGIKDTRTSRTELVNMLSPGSICCLTENWT